MLPKFPDVDSIVHYLREPSLSSSLTHSTATTSNARKTDNQLESSKQQGKTKDQGNTMNTNPSVRILLKPQLKGDIQILPEGRVRYGPITVNPRKQPSKTLFTGRRSKYELLSGDEDDKRRDRRERNRVAAMKCREKREHVLNNLESEHLNELNNNQCLEKLVEDLGKRKNQLELVLVNHLNECTMMKNSPIPTQSSMIFGDTAFLSLINNTELPPPLPSLQQPIIYNDDEELCSILDPLTVLTNSAYTTDDSNSILMSEQQQLQTFTMTNSSIERLISSFKSPTISMENNSNHSMLFNSAIGSSCAKQHSNSSEDDSLPSTLANHYVC
ncbi:unnamed protein product [Rotaria socialis]|uniref:BZIP domain-containing protein n=1 Tax=Rotaria socialis TaxID=392032 RepID=A0A820VVB3_9BILA|nr:unnamed protein product [Rotaria socialis]CAF3702992.1 unnamed protein product [Rotaria socialis]CAF4354782.1 unnamed protein product [Rotaria socialis]CAF4505527.1 unnamed protein product [Rotaria socialis]